jgi:hypothetical protein
MLMDQAKFFCFECDCEYYAEADMDECKYCGTEDVMMTETPEEGISQEDVWQYGNDYDNPN